ncbi:Peptidase C10, streptopain, partial [Candidatus Magnetomorum sp. HK-1]
KPIDMDYGMRTSIAETGDAATSLYQYFGYNISAVYKVKADYSDETWSDMLMEELNHHRPVQYRGKDLNSGGHSFVCDGYQGTEYFHFNWGWGGSSDGYYLLSALNASSYTFSSYQKAIFGIQPGIEYQRAAELSESFENDFPETGWSQTIINDSSPSPVWSQVSSGLNPSCTPSDGTKMIQFNSYSTPDGAEARLTLPSLDLTNYRYPRLIFSMYNETSNSEKNDEGITVQISENGTDWTDLRFYPRYTLSTGWKRYYVDLTYYTGKTIWIGLSGHSANGSNIYLDQVEIDQAIPTCFMASE